MSLAERRGANEMATEAGRLRLLAGPPLIAPALHFVFPTLVPGEEEALSRGSIFVEAKLASGPPFLAQFAIGFTGNDVASGLWLAPHPGELLVCAGGYAYVLNLSAPAQTRLLPLRPVVDVVVAPQRLVLLGYHHALVVEEDDESWKSPRISWEGISATELEGDALHGTGWDMHTDEEVPFSLDLKSRKLAGGGFRAS